MRDEAQERSELLLAIQDLGYESLRYSIFNEHRPSEWETRIDYNPELELYEVYSTMDRASTGSIFKFKTFEEAKEKDIEKSTPETKKPRVKSPEAKQAVVDADMETISAYGLVYDYANKGLVEVVQDFLAESGIDPSQVAFTYRNAITGEQFAMNDLQPMTAGSTYKLPLNMLVVDEVAKGKLNLTDRFDITNTYYEYVGEHDNYVAAFDGAMSIPDS